MLGHHLRLHFRLERLEGGFHFLIAQEQLAGEGVLDALGEEGGVEIQVGALEVFANVGADGVADFVPGFLGFGGGGLFLGFRFASGLDQEKPGERQREAGGECDFHSWIWVEYW